MLLQEWSGLWNARDLKKVPHFTPLCAASKHLLAKAQADTLLERLLEWCRKAKMLSKRSRLAAIDSTGLESRHASTYCTKRCKQHTGYYRSRYPKLSAVGDGANHLIPGFVIDRGPKSDLWEA